MTRGKIQSGIGAALAAAVAPWPALAASLPAIVPECARNQTAAVPQISCAMEMFGNVATLILGLTGSFALLMFVYGGFLMVISAGDSSKVNAGKKILMNAVIGIVIIMGAGIVLRYALGILVRNNSFKLIGQPCSVSGGVTSATNDFDTDNQAADGGLYVMQPDGTIKCEATAQK